MPRNTTRRKQHGGDKHESNIPYAISPQKYMGVMAPYIFMIQQRDDGRYYCDFISVKGDGYKFLRVFTSLSEPGDPKQRIRRAIRERRAIDAAP